MSTDDHHPPKHAAHPTARPPKGKGRVFDVMRPGKTPASPTSRPVIMGHKAEAKNAQIAVSGIGERDNLLDSKKKVEVKPVSSTVAPSPAVVSSLRSKDPKDNSAPSAPVAAESLPEASMDLAAAALDSELAAEKANAAIAPPADSAASSGGVAGVEPFAAASIASPIVTSQSAAGETTPMPPAAAPGNGTPAHQNFQPTTSAPAEAATAMQSRAAGSVAVGTPAAQTPNSSDTFASVVPNAPSQAGLIPTETATSVKPLTPEELATANAEVADMRMPGEAPIIDPHAARSHRVRNVALVIILILLTLAAIDLLLDSAVITTNSIPHTHFFGM